MVRVRKVRLSVHKDECPVCDHLFDKGEGEEDIRAHVEHCINMTRAQNIHQQQQQNQNINKFGEGVKLPPISSLEETVLDVDNLEASFGPPQYTSNNLFLPPPLTSHKVETPLLKLSKNEKYPQQFLLSVIANQQQQLALMPRCRVCLESSFVTPLVSTVCWHVMCEACWLNSLRYKRVCPACSSITAPEDLRRIYL